MFQRKNSLFQNVFTVIAVILFSVPCVLYAEEKADAIDELSLYDLRNLDQVLITATKNPMELKKAPAIATVITSEHIRNMGARNIMDVLKHVPGLSLFQSVASKGPDVLEVRGISTNFSEKILLMIDGHRMNDAYEGSWRRICNDLMVENIKRIEIVRGPGSALYGANAFIAVINIITKTARDIDGQQFSAGFGSFGTQHYNSLFSYADSKFEISGHLDYHDTDGASSLIEEDALSGSPGSIAPGNTQEFSEKLDFGVRMKYGDFNLNGMIIDRKNGPYIGAGLALNDETVLKYSQAIGNIEYTKDLTDDLNFSAKLYGGYYSADWDFEIYPEGFTGDADAGLLGNPMLKNNNFGTELMANYVLGAHYLTAGFNYEHTRVYDVDSFDNFDNVFAEKIQTPPDKLFCDETSRDFWALYLQNVWKITDNDSLTLGVRYDYYNDFGGTINPRVGYVHTFGNELTAKLLYGSAFRAPSFTDLYEKNNPVLKGNPNLDPEKINTYEIGLEYPFLKYCTLRASYFHNEIKNLIMVSDEPDETALLYNINKTGKTKVDGIEVELAFNISKKNYGYINCSYQDGKDVNDKPLAKVADWKANAGFNYQICKYLNMNLNFAWVGKMRREEGDSRDSLPSQSFIDLCMIAKEFYNNLEILGSVHNLFDEDYRVPSASVISNDFPINRRMFLLVLCQV